MVGTNAKVARQLSRDVYKNSLKSLKCIINHILAVKVLRDMVDMFPCTSLIIIRTSVCLLTSSFTAILGNNKEMPYEGTESHTAYI